jgi:glyoxylase-like metal-dependent hydrolase (beta-lactamase superfamily II)
MGRRPEDVREIVLTHYHDDHRGGAAELAGHSGARIVAHCADAPVIRGETPQPPPNLIDFERPIAEGVLARMAPATFGDVAPGSVDLQTLARALVTSTLPPVPVDREVENGDTLAGGGVVIHIPGHTPGSIAVLAPDQGVTFTGDALASYEGRVIPGVFNLDQHELHASIRKLARLEFGTACFGHGAPIVGEASRQIRALAESF